MKHLLSKRQIKCVNNTTAFTVIKNGTFYEFYYNKSQFKRLIIYAQIESIFDERSISQQLEDYCKHYVPDEEAAKRFLAVGEPRLIDYLRYYEQVKDDLTDLLRAVQ